MAKRLKYTKDILSHMLVGNNNNNNNNQNPLLQAPTQQQPVQQQSSQNVLNNFQPQQSAVQLQSGMMGGYDRNLDGIGSTGIGSSSTNLQMMGSSGNLNNFNFGSTNMNVLMVNGNGTSDMG
jgi:hypothetical protein